ncbi:MAG TPA: hypothetical protein VEL07_13505 [Planctomycetota bacterium]|nr:hypothetical protein [Planctomycetota bacterium]
MQPIHAPSINRFLADKGMRIAANPCVSPDMCLDWPALAVRVRADSVAHHSLSAFSIASADIALVEDLASGDHAWIARTRVGADLSGLLADGVAVPLGYAFPATWDNLLRLKNLVQEHDPESTIFPRTSAALERSSLGIGARFTTLHWPAVEWAMAHLDLPVNANQNSIPRELVYDVDAMVQGTLDRVPFPFIGTSVPEGHQGQSVEGMSHGALLSKLKTGFHRRRIAWGFNADHQPIGGKFDAREDQLVRGCVLATSITFDLSPELAATPALDATAAKAWCAREVGAERMARLAAGVAAAGESIAADELARLVAQVYPAARKMVVRDQKYAAERARRFTTAVGRDYLRELSIDELPGLTTPATLATMLVLCADLGLRIHYVAPAFGFQKNFPFDDDVELERRIGAAWRVCQRLDVAIGFHSGSGKSARDYQICGRITGGRLEIKTSGRYTYEMGVALAASSDARDQALWRDWWAFTRDLAVTSAFASDATERDFARRFISHALKRDGRPAEPFADAATCRAAIDALTPSPEHMFWFEYNFLFVLAADGRADKAALGDHGLAGYTQRARFYAISDQARLKYAQGVARYIAFLAEHTGLAPVAACRAATAKLDAYPSYAALLADIAPV